MQRSRHQGCRLFFCRVLRGAARSVWCGCMRWARAPFRAALAHGALCHQVMRDPQLYTALALTPPSLTVACAARFRCPRIWVQRLP